MRFVLALVSVVTPGLVLAQIPAPERQKIALALSGGSALGLAHIGVIEYFEEHHIPIDYITGTSMGALVGGFFARAARVPANWNRSLWKQTGTIFLPRPPGLLVSQSLKNNDGTSLQGPSPCGLDVIFHFRAG